mgnify:CR=1 FL=1
MERNLEKMTVVNDAASLEDKEGYAVDFNGETVTSAGTGCFGIVTSGRPAGMASVVAYNGSLDAYVDGRSSNVGEIAVNDPLTAGGGAASGELTKATVGTHPIRAYAMEAATTQTKIKVFLV